MFRVIDEEKHLIGLSISPDEQLIKLSKQVMQAQDACNMVALAKAYAASCSELVSHPSNKLGSIFVSQNPITHLWLDKLCDLGKIDRDTSSKSWSCVMDWADGKDAEMEVQVSDQRDFSYLKRELTPA